MSSMFERLRAYHQAFWIFDPWYRRAWYAGPQALAASVLALVLLPDSSGPSKAQWAKPITGASTTSAPADADQKTCDDNKIEVAKRGEACDRLVKSGKLSGHPLAMAFFGRAWARWAAQDLTGAIADFSEVVTLDPTDLVALNNRGAIRLERSELAEALRDFDAALKINATNALALANKAEVLRRQIKLEDAQGEVKKALDADPNSARAMEIQGLILADIKNGEVVREAGADLPLCRNAQSEIKSRGEACDRLIKRGGLPAGIMAQAYVGRAWMRDNLKDNVGAIADYSETIRLDPKSADAFNNRGGLLLQRGELIDALRDFDEAIKINARHVWAMANRAEAWRMQGKLAEAQSEIKRAIAIEASNPRAKVVDGRIAADLLKQQEGKHATEPKNSDQPASTQQNAETDALRKRARAHFKDKDFDSAIADWTEVIRKDGASWLDFNERGRGYLVKGRLAEALADFDRAVNRAGHGFEAHYNRALVYERMREFAKVKDDIEAAIGQHGATDAIYFLALARNYTSMGDHRQASYTYDKLNQVYDKDKSVKDEDRASAFLWSGQAKKSLVMQERSNCHTQIPPDPNCMNSMRFAVALHEFQQALVFRPNYADVFVEQGLIASEIGNTKAAIDEYTKAIKADPNSSAAYNNRGVQHERDKQPELAFADYNDAIRLDQNNKFAWANRGILFGSRSQRQRAIDDLNRALSIDRDYAYAKKNLERLLKRR